MYDPNVLAHHGVKGQKWGVRRTKQQLGYVTTHNRKAKVGSSLFEGGPIDSEDLVAIHLILKAFEYSRAYVACQERKYDALSFKAAMQKHKFKPNSTEMLAHSKGRLTANDVADVNLRYKESGYTQNSMCCTAALELRLRTNSAVQAGRSMNGWNARKLQGEWFKASKPEASCRTNQDVDTYLKDKMPNKSSGAIFYTYDPGPLYKNFTHVVHWTKDQNGTVQIQDGQNNQIFDSYTKSLKRTTQVGDAEVYRLDNKPLDYDAMTKDNALDFDVEPSRTDYNRYNQWKEAKKHE